MQTGITPARAGKTFRPHFIKHLTGDHPRSRGKDLLCSQTIMLRVGSPPLARERPLVYQTIMLRVGSPPLARERPISLYSLLLSSRITPARAGKTKKNKYILAETRDHPRSRGKDDIVDRMSATVQGSPPLARERPGSDPRPAACPGITPARAGKTNPFALLWCKSWDHPRSRGKDIPDAASPVWYQGSPPLARERP